jgi:hypothetical protein
MCRRALEKKLALKTRPSTARQENEICRNSARMELSLRSAGAAAPLLPPSNNDRQIVLLSISPSRSEMGDKRGCRSRTPLPPSYFNASHTHSLRHQPLYYFILYRAAIGRGSKVEALSRSRGASESIIFHARTYLMRRFPMSLSIIRARACLLCARV